MSLVCPSKKSTCEHPHLMGACYHMTTYTLWEYAITWPPRGLKKGVVKMNQDIRNKVISQNLSSNTEL